MLAGDRTRRMATQRRFMGVNESPDRFIGKPTIQKNHRFLF